MNTLLRNMVDDFARANMHIGALLSDPEWRDDQWASIPPETFKAMCIAGAEGDLLTAANIWQDALSKLAHIEAEHKYGVKI